MFKLFSTILLLFVSLANHLLALRTMSYEDIVRLQRPQDVALSADGAKVAYVIKRGDIEKNKNIFSVYLWDSEDGSTQILCELDSVKKLIWQGSNEIYVLGMKEGNYQILTSKNVLISSPVPIAAFALSLEGNDLYYSQTIYTSEEVIKRNKEEGYVYRFGIDNGSCVINNKEYSHCIWEEIWHLDVKSGKNKCKWKIPYKNWSDSPSYNKFYSILSNLALSENGRYLSFNTRRFGDLSLGEKSFMDDLSILDLENTTKQVLLEDSPSAKTTPCWACNQLIFQEMDFRDNTYKLYAWDAESGRCFPLDFFSSERRIHSLNWNEINQGLVVDDGKQLFQISIGNKTVEKMEVPDDLFHLTSKGFSFNRDLRFFAAISEDSNTPPQVVVYDLENGVKTPITSLNSELKNVALGRVEKIIIENEDLISEGYLVHPVGEIEGKKYPLIIASYGFYGQTFIADGEWHSSFPVQTLAANDYMILLLNNPMDKKGSHKVQQLLGPDRVAIFEHAVDRLNEMGCIDPDKVGLYGWSHGAFVVEYLISHSNKFKVACIGEGGDYNPANFWVSGDLVGARILVNTFGGPPWGVALQNYLDFSPFYNVDKIKTPLFMEFAGGHLQGLEMYTPLRYLNVPSELVIYEGEAHNFECPKARIASMTRKMDWFNYWLLDKRNGIDKEDQYARWDKMRQGQI